DEVGRCVRQGECSGISAQDPRGTQDCHRALPASHLTNPYPPLPASQVTTSLVVMVATMHHLMGAAEIGRRLGLSRQRVQQLLRRPDFPTPDVDLAMGKVWRTEDVEEWIRVHRPADAGPV